MEVDSAMESSHTPPFVRALYDAAQSGGHQVLKVTDSSGNDSWFRVNRGRVIEICHKASNDDAMLELLVRSSLMKGTVAETLKRKSLNKGKPIDELVVDSKIVSRSTMQQIKDSLNIEAVLEVLLDFDASVSEITDDALGGQVGSSCSLAIPHLLKEAMRRAGELPEIKQFIPADDMVFSKAHHHTGRNPKWEDLNLGHLERQVYFYVDGFRTVAEVANITCQPMHVVHRALVSLIKSRHIVHENGKAGSKTTQGRQGLLRAMSMLTVIVILVGLALSLIGSNSAVWSKSASEATLFNPFRALENKAADDRVAGAIRLYQLMFGERPENLNDLLTEDLVAPADAKHSAFFTSDGAYRFYDLEETSDLDEQHD